MRFEIKASELQYAVGIVAPFADPRGSSEYLQYIKATEKDGFIRFEATNIEDHAFVDTPYISAAMKESMMLDAEYIKKFADDFDSAETVTFEQKSNKIVVSQGKKKFSINLPSSELFADGFPEFSGNVDNAVSFQADTERFISAINQSLYAIPSKDHRHILKGVHLSIKDNEMTVIATDGKKARKDIVSIPEMEGSECSPTIRKDFWSRLFGNLKSDDDLNVVLSNSSCIFEFGTVTIKTNSINGKYPNVDAVIPQDSNFTAEIDSAEVMRVMRSAMMTADDSSKSCVMEFDKGTCKVQAAKHGLGSFEGQFGYNTKDGDGAILNMNCQFVMETLKNIRSPRVLIKIKSSTSPVKFESEENPSLTCIVMPIKGAVKTETVDE